MPATPERPPTHSVERRRIAEVFGDVLPESSADDVEADPRASTDTERWYTENRPPHHDGE